MINQIVKDLYITMRAMPWALVVRAFSANLSGECQIYSLAVNTTGVYQPPSCKFGTPAKSVNYF